MYIKKIINKSLNFILNRIAELIGLSITISSFLLFISLMSYSPEDPNFVFSNDAEIKNLLIGLENGEKWWVVACVNQAT